MAMAAVLSLIAFAVTGQEVCAVAAVVFGAGAVGIVRGWL
jgi:hypothetical protein